MKKVCKFFFMVVAPVAVLGIFSGCATTPKCDNDACYNRAISSVGTPDGQKPDDQDFDNGHTNRYQRDGFNRE